MKIKPLMLLAIALITSWTLNAQEKAKTKDQVTDAELSALMMTCYVCHNPRVKSHEEAIAPPLVAVKYMYKQKYKTKEDFVNATFDFIMEPTEDKTILSGAVKKFGVMPQMPLEPSQVKLILNYIYDNEIETPKWFPEHFQENHGKAWKGQK